MVFQSWLVDEICFHCKVNTNQFGVSRLLCPEHLIGHEKILLLNTGIRASPGTASVSTEWTSAIPAARAKAPCRGRRFRGFLHQHGCFASNLMGCMQHSIATVSRMAVKCQRTPSASRCPFCDQAVCRATWTWQCGSLCSYGHGGISSWFFISVWSRCAHPSASTRSHCHASHAARNAGPVSTFTWTCKPWKNPGGRLRFFRTGVCWGAPGTGETGAELRSSKKAWDSRIESWEDSYGSRTCGKSWYGMVQ